MKNDELLDLISELKVDDAFVDEALGEQDGAPVRVYAGSSKRSPMRIAAPIAACLAVAAAAGFVFVNISRGKLAAGPAASIEESSEESAHALSEEELIEKCKEIVTEESDLISQGEVVWETNNLDIDFDGNDELLLYPRIDGKTVKDVGVRVFQLTENDIKDFGAFGKDDDSIDLLDIRKDERDNVGEQYYYCFSHDDTDGLYEGVRFVSYDEETGTVNSDNPLMLVHDSRQNEDINEGCYENGRYLGGGNSILAFQEFSARIRAFPDDIAERYCEFTKDEVAMCEKDALTRNGKLDLEELLTPRMWHVGEYDINFDGENELLISLYNFTNMRGVFVYDSNCEYLGSFETENGLCDSELMYCVEEDGEQFWYYYGIESLTKRGGSGYESRLERVSINKLIVENNSFSTERLMHEDLIWNSGEVDHYEYWIGDKEVTEDEYRKARHLCPGGAQGSHDFDLTNPVDWKYTSLFEDSDIYNNERGEAKIEIPDRFKTED